MLAIEGIPNGTLGDDHRRQGLIDAGARQGLDQVGRQRQRALSRQED